QSLSLSLFVSLCLSLSLSVSLCLSLSLSVSLSLHLSRSPSCTTVKRTGFVFLLHNNLRGACSHRSTSSTSFCQFFFHVPSKENASVSVPISCVVSMGKHSCRVSGHLRVLGFLGNRRCMLVATTVDLV